jgi:hypothetical protein
MQTGTTTGNKKQTNPKRHIPDILETELAIQSISKYKSPSTDVLIQLYQAAQLLINILYRLIEGIRTEEKVPTD